MERNVSMDEISDGKLYGLNDMVRADCGGCKGCSSCCKGMGESVVLDPLDLHRLSIGLGETPEKIAGSVLDFHMEKGLIFPCLKMAGEEEACIFLNEQGRCRIHPFRPGFCRMFPLGRFYEDGGFKYFLQVHECPMEPKTKVKVRKWIDTPDLKEYEAFVLLWHDFYKELQGRLDSQEKAKTASLYVLREFYLKPYPPDRFYEEFKERVKTAGTRLP